MRALRSIVTAFWSHVGLCCAGGYSDILEARSGMRWAIPVFWRKKRKVLFCSCPFCFIDAVFVFFLSPFVSFCKAFCLWQLARAAFVSVACGTCPDFVSPGFMLVAFPHPPLQTFSSRFRWVPNEQVSFCPRLLAKAWHYEFPPNELCSTISQGCQSSQDCWLLV